MLKILNKTRKVSGKMSVPKQIMTTFFALLFGGGMGIVAKFLDSNRLPSFFDWLDLSNFLGRTAPWIFIAVCLAVFSKSPLKAGINVFAFFVGMLIGYYVWTSVFAGFYPDIPYLMRWLILAVVSPFLAFLIWYARGRVRLQSEFLPYSWQYSVALHLISTLPISEFCISPNLYFGLQASEFCSRM